MPLFVFIYVCIWQLTLEVELLVSFLISFAVPAVSAWQGKKAMESADCVEEINTLNDNNINAPANAAVHDKSLKTPSRAAAAWSLRL